MKDVTCLVSRANPARQLSASTYLGGFGNPLSHSVSAFNEVNCNKRIVEN